MKLAVGYPVLEEEERPFAEVIAGFREQVAEVYFAWPGEASGRSPFGGGEPGAEARLEEDLRELRAMGVGLDLLVNANCYGAEAASARLAERVVGIVEHLAGGVGLEVVTTTSPFIARAIKERFPGVRTRASVNMRIGSVEGMSYVAEAFDSFCVQRDYNRDLGRLEELRGWCEENGKELCGLVNSGCLRNCSGQTFHDNLVAHEREMGECGAAGEEALVCRGYLRDPGHWPALLKATWIRPEDLHHYEGAFALAKVATRMHARPERVVRAYARGRHGGNLLDLLEPGYGALLGGQAIENGRFPEDWFERTTSCEQRCGGCGYCEETLREVLGPAGGKSESGQADGEGRGARRRSKGMV